MGLTVGGAWLVKVHDDQGAPMDGYDDFHEDTSYIFPDGLQEGRNAKLHVKTSTQEITLKYACAGPKKVTEIIAIGSVASFDEGSGMVTFDWSGAATKAPGQSEWRASSKPTKCNQVSLVGPGAPWTSAAKASQFLTRHGQCCTAESDEARALVPMF